MYSNKLAVAIKTAGKVLREQGDKVYLPFGSEYSIFLKNLNSVRALVRVELDGKSVTDGEELVIYGNSELNLERFLKKGNMESGNRFKFIERTSKVEAHRGVEAEDGILRVEFQFEKVQPKPIVVETIHKHYHDHYKCYPDPWYPPYKPHVFYNCAQPADTFYGNSVNIGTSGIAIASSALGSSSGAVTANACSVSMSGGSAPASLNAVFTSTSSADSGVTRSLKSSAKSTKSAAPVAEAQMLNDAGITVAGSVSNQQFQNAAWFPVDDEKFVIVLKVLGQVGDNVVEKPVLVRQKQTCSTCGTRNRGQNQFCRECGTALELVGESPKRRKVVGVRG